MIRRLFGVMGVLPLTVLMLGCTGPDNSEYAQKVLPIAEARCAKCHLDDNKRGDFSLERHKTVMKGGKSGAAAVPGDASASLLYQVVSGAHPTLRMPKTGDPLSDEEIGVIKAWIDGGAL